MKATRVGSLFGEDVYLYHDQLCLEKDHKYLVKMSDEEKDLFINQRLYINGTGINKEVGHATN